MDLLHALQDAGVNPTADALGYYAGLDVIKSAGDAQSVYALSGRLYLSSSGWLLLTVPNAVLHGLFDALEVPGLEKPTRDTNDPDSQVNAHISVMAAWETEQIGRDKISERGHTFKYQLGNLKVVRPDGWDGVSKVYFVEVASPELRNLRKSYGLSPLPTTKDGGEKPFHITIGLVRTGVLHPNEKSKAAELLELLKEADLLPGGKGDDLEPDDVDVEELADGRQHEQEHTDRQDLATEIALDHLAEDEHYYTHLEELEDEVKIAEVVGIPSRQNMGDLSQLKPGLIDFIIQRHLAEKAGPHYDVRFGTPETGLFALLHVSDRLFDLIARDLLVADLLVRHLLGRSTIEQ